MIRASRLSKKDRLAINLSRGILVSWKDRDILRNDIWHLNKGYACKNKLVNGKVKTTAMHRVVIERKIGRKLRKGEVTDHINRNRADNRRRNLRVTDYNGNSQNASLCVTNTTGYRGVYFDKRRQRFSIVINHMGRQVRFGMFRTAKEADVVVRRKRREMGFLGD